MITIFVDLDGGLVDFDSQFKKYFKYPIKAKISKKEWIILNNFGVPFWATMRWLKGGKKLWAFIKPYKPTILTAPSEDNSSIVGKRI